MAPATSGAPATTSPSEGCGCPEYGVTRRTLLQGLAAGGALGATVTLAGETASARYAFGATSAPGDVLVVLSLRGGFDGLNVVVPAGDPAYAAARPKIGIPAKDLLKLDTMFGLHPAMAPLLPFWKAGTFGAVHAVGQASPSRSHFEAMAEMERAAPGSGVRTGWLDRTIGIRPAGTPFQATQVGSVTVPASLLGTTPELSMRSLDSFDVPGAWNAEERARWVTALGAMTSGGLTSVSRPASVALKAVTTAAAVSEGAATPAGGATYPETGLGKALRDVARLVKAKVGLQVATLDFGNWDMHAGMGTSDKGWMRDHLSELASALAAFATDLGPAMSGVTLVTLSEFGRRVGENGSGGVDHGHGNAVLLLGGGIVGGRVHGRWPGLAPDKLVDGDLDGTTDYRLLLGEVLQKRCGAGSLSSVFPGLSGTVLGVARAR